MNLDHKIGNYILLMCYVFRLLLAQSYILGILFLMLSEQSSKIKYGCFLIGIQVDGFLQT